MDEESKQLLKRSLEVGEENNKLLHQIRGTMRLGRIMSIVYWLFIIATAFGAYYFIEPYISDLMGVYGGAKDSIESVNSIFDN